MIKCIGFSLILISLISCDMIEAGMKVPQKFISSLEYIDLGEKAIYDYNLLFMRAKAAEIVICRSFCSHECIAELQETVVPYLIRWGGLVKKFVQIKADEPLLSKFVNLYLDYQYLEQCQLDIGFTEEQVLYLNELHHGWLKAIVRGSDDK